MDDCCFITRRKKLIFIPFEGFARLTVMVKLEVVAEAALTVAENEWYSLVDFDNYESAKAVLTMFY